MQEQKTHPSKSHHFDRESSLSTILEPALYIVATPIGHLGDITLRALQVLNSCDHIACEDTRTSGKLLRHYEIKTPTLAYHEHNSTTQLPIILTLLEAGKAVALISDAGTPLISDPGYRLVKDILQAGHRVIPIPGASSPIVALSAAGLPTDAFFFGGFLPSKKAARQKRLSDLKSIPGTLVFLESARRLRACLEDCMIVFGAERHAVTAREMTKMFETFKAGRLTELADFYEQNGPPKGEVVLLIEPPGDKQVNEEEIDLQLRDLMGKHPIKQVSELLALETGLSRRDLYQRALSLKREETD